MPIQLLASVLPLPRGWPIQVKSAILHVIGLAQLCLAYTRSWAANSCNERIRLKAELDRTRQELSLLRETLRIHRLRMEQIPPHRRPHYQPTQRLAILQLKAARNWSLEQTAQEFLVTADTIRSWLQRVDEQGPDALVQMPTPVNRFPDLVRYLVQNLKTLCPMLGKVNIAQFLARAGLHLGVSTVGRILKEAPASPPKTECRANDKGRTVTSKYPNHLWQIDLTIPIGPGFWTMWPPHCLPQRWPLAWWVGIVMDHYSRRILGITLFDRLPTSEAVRAFLERVIARTQAKPRHLVTDKGPQFWCQDFKQWCGRKDIQVRFGAIGQHGSIAVIERLILTLKQTLGWLPLIPLRRKEFQRILEETAAWYNCHRPHMSLSGRTPEEVYRRLRPAHRQPRFEPRPLWPRRSVCASPMTLVKGQPGVCLKMQLAFVGDHRQLPRVALKRVA